MLTVCKHAFLNMCQADFCSVKDDAKAFCHNKLQFVFRALNS